MTRIVLASLVVLGACTSSGTDSTCKDDHCVCVPDEPCAHDCTPGGLDCEVQCAPGGPCSVGCATGEACHVECSSSTGCSVDCAGSTDCNVTCPAGSSCSVENCGANCDVTCGLGGLPTRSGTTAHCP